MARSQSRANTTTEQGLSSDVISAARDLSVSPSNNDKRSSWWREELTAVNVVSAALLVGYFVAFVASLHGRWFDRSWTTDDATQQLYPFYDALYPSRFEDDLISEVMRGCLPPLHYWLGYGITLVTRNPIMTGHWMMLVQLSVAAVFLFAAVRKWSATAPALLSVVWFLHTRDTMQRLTGGLPRGWTPAMFAAFLYCVSARRHTATLAVILAGILLNPPGAVVVGIAYGAILLWRATCESGSQRGVARGQLARSIALVPLFVAVAFGVVQRSPAVGQMVSFEEASLMPEFQRPNGRFPFLPLDPAAYELRTFGLQAFISRLNPTDPAWKGQVYAAVAGALALIVCGGLVRRRRVVPVEILLFGASALLTYGVSRAVAFRLFVPDRHLQIPMVFVCVPLFCVGVWRVATRGRVGAERDESAYADTKFRTAWPAALGFVALGWLIIQGTGKGLGGDANFNYPTWKRGEMYSWIRENTAPEAVIACHPTHCDGMQLFAARRALVTTETSQPFYPRFNLEMRRRSEVALKAHYAESLPDLVTLLEPEGVSHFVFRRRDFRPEVLREVSYFPPLDSLVRQLVTRPSGKFAFNELPKEIDPVKYPYVVHIDAVSIIVDIQALAASLRQQGWIAPQSTLSSSVQRHASRRYTIFARGQGSATELRS